MQVPHCNEKINFEYSTYELARHIMEEPAAANIFRF